MSLGITLNNPFDIRISNNPWKGKITPSQNDQFETFSSMLYGLRAGCLDLVSAQKRHGLTTIAQLAARYAPPNENDTEAYIQTVCNTSGFERDKSVDLTQIDNLNPVAYGFLVAEQGSAAASIPSDLRFNAAMLALEDFTL